MKLASLRIDTSNTAGKWVEKIPGCGDLRLKVRPAGNPDHRRRLDELAREVPRAERIRGLGAEKAREIDASAILDAVLFDWGNMEGDGVLGTEGQPLPFTRDVALKLLIDPTYQTFRDAVDWAADAVSVEGQQDAKADLGN